MTRSLPPSIGICAPVVFAKTEPAMAQTIFATSSDFAARFERNAMPLDVGGTLVAGVDGRCCLGVTHDEVLSAWKRQYLSATDSLEWRDIFSLHQPQKDTATRTDILSSFVESERKKDEEVFTLNLTSGKTRTK